MFQLIARVNNLVNFYYSKNEHKWLNDTFCCVDDANEFAISNQEEIRTGLEMMREIFGPIPATIDFKLICLNWKKMKKDLEDKWKLLKFVSVT